MRWQLIVSCAVPWLVLDGPAYLLPIAGLIAHNAKLTAIGATWFMIIHTPVCHESIIVIPAGMWIHKKLFPRDTKTKYRLLRLYVTAKRDWKAFLNAVKKKFRRIHK